MLLKVTNEYFAATRRRLTSRVPCASLFFVFCLLGMPSVLQAASLSRTQLVGFAFQGAALIGVYPGLEACPGGARGSQDPAWRVSKL